MSAYMDTRIAGIPCTVRIDYYVSRAPDHRCVDSDMDYLGYCEMNYTVCDRKGRPAPWLERKMTKRDEQEVESEIHEFMKAQANDDR